MSVAPDAVRLFCDGVTLGIALATAGVLSARLRQRTERLALFLALITALLMSCRMLNQIWSWVGVDITVEVIVSALPVTVLLLAESLLRRHAERWIKLSALIGGATILILTLFRTEPVAGLRIPLMGIVLVVNFALVLWLLLTRDKTSLMRNENARITCLLVGFAIMIPLAAGDFWPGSPKESLDLGAIGALIGILVIVRGIGGRVSVTGFLVDLLIVATGAFGLTQVSGVIFGSEGFQMRSLATCTAALVLATIIIGQLRQQFIASGSEPLSRHLARARTDSIDSLLNDLREHRLIVSARLLEGEELGRLAAPEVLPFMEATPVASKALLERDDGRPDSLARGATLSLLTRSQMSHVVSLSISPPRLLLVEGSGFSGDVDEEADLTLLSRLAQRIQTGHRDD